MTDLPLIRTRIITLARPADPAVAARLAASDGIHAARLLPDGRGLEVSYDLRRVRLPHLTARLTAEGLALSNGLLARWGRAWAAFKDDNRRDSADVVHQCCNLPPQHD